MKRIIIDLTKCIGCYNCQLACKDEHVGNDWMPYTKPQPEGHFWMRVQEEERGTLPKVKVTWRPTPCMHCADAPCAKACAENAITVREDGIVLISPDKCTGTGACVEACPYGAIYFNNDLNIAQKCTMCAHLLDSGWKEPRCVTACPTEALRFGNDEDLEDLIAMAKPLNPESGANPRVLYIGLSKRFVAGEVYSPTEDECVEGAVVTLTDMVTGQALATKTNNYGDFWLDNVAEGTYALTVEKDGYYPKEIKSIRTDQDVNLGSIRIYKRV